MVLWNVFFVARFLLTVNVCYGEVGTYYMRYRDRFLHNFLLYKVVVAVGGL